MSSLNDERKKINEIDKEMAKLFEMRMRAVEKIAEYKRSAGLPIFDAEREEEIVRERAKLIEDDELRTFYVNFLKNNMAVSRRYQEKLLSGMKVAFSGTVGAFAHIAATKLFPTAEKCVVIFFCLGKQIIIFQHLLGGIDDGLPCFFLFEGQGFKVCQQFFQPGFHSNQSFIKQFSGR